VWPAFSGRFYSPPARNLERSWDSFFNLTNNNGRSYFPFRNSPGAGDCFPLVFRLTPDLSVYWQTTNLWSIVEASHPSLTLGERSSEPPFSLMYPFFRLPLDTRLPLTRSLPATWPIFPPFLSSRPFSIVRLFRFPLTFLPKTGSPCAAQRAGKVLFFLGPNDLSSKIRK